MWNGVDVSLTWGSDPILGQSVGFTAGINLSARPALTWLKIQEVRTRPLPKVQRFEFE